MRPGDGTQDPRRENHVADAIVSEEQHAVGTVAPIGTLAARAAAHHRRDCAIRRPLHQPFGALQHPPGGGSDLPVGQHHPRLDATLGEARERHAEVGPAHAAAQADETLVDGLVFTLDADRDATRPTATREIGERANEVVERAEVRERELQDAEILAAQKLLAEQEGIFCEPASAVSIAGMMKDVRSGRIPAGSTIVCTLTGHGLKDPDTAIRQSPPVLKIDATLEAVKRAIIENIDN